MPYPLDLGLKKKQNKTKQNKNRPFKTIVKILHRILIDIEVKDLIDIEVKDKSYLIEIFKKIVKYLIHNF